MNEKEYITVSQAAEILSVTPATIYNWIKTGKIKNLIRENPSYLLNSLEIERIYEQLNNNTYSKYLKKRRNKNFISGISIPIDYVSYEPYRDQLKEILYSLPHISDMRLLLMEIILKLLNNRRKIKLNLSSDANCYILAYQQSIILEDTFINRILKDIIDLKKIVITESDLAQLNSIKEIDIQWVKDQDFLGFVYMSISSIRERKRSGSYYTAYHIVDNLTNEVLELLADNTENPDNTEKLYLDTRLDLGSFKIIDPCCGSGNFLLQLFTKLKEYFISLGYSEKTSEEILFQKIIHGNDTDQIAISLAKLNLILASSLSPEDIKKFNLLCANTLIEQRLHSNSTFSLIIGNPPWGSVIDPNDRYYYNQLYTSAKGPCESFTLFLERSLQLLKTGGILSFVLPESFLNITSHKNVRKIILSNTKIKKIKMRGNDFKNVFSPIITLTLQKVQPSPEHYFSIATSKKTTQINQINFLNNKHYIIAGPQTSEEIGLISHMKSLPNLSLLKSNAKFALGIVTGDNHNYIHKKCPPNGELIIKGTNIYKYKYIPEENFILFKPDIFQQVAPISIYRAEEKLIYRFINRNLVFAYDNNKVLTLNSANVIIPEIEDLPIKYILAILNSRAVQAFYTLSFNSIKVLRQYLESIPIPKAEIKHQDSIINCVDQIIKSQDAKVIVENYQIIDEIIMNLFDLSLKQRQLVNNLNKNIKYLFP